MLLVEMVGVRGFFVLVLESFPRVCLQCLLRVHLIPFWFRMFFHCICVPTTRDFSCAVTFTCTFGHFDFDRKRSFWFQ